MHPSSSIIRHWPLAVLASALVPLILSAQPAPPAKPPAPSSRAWWPGPTPEDFLAAMLAEKNLSRPDAPTLADIWAAAPDQPLAKPAQRRRVLVWGRIWRHGGSAVAEHALRIIGEKSGAFEAVCSDDPRLLLPASLKDFDAIFWNSLHDPDPVMPPDWKDWPKGELNGPRQLETDIKESILNFVLEGKGIAGLRGSIAAFRNWEEYHEMMGAAYVAHFHEQELAIRVEEPGHPLVANFTDGRFQLNSTAYLPGGPFSREGVRVLLSLDRESVANPLRLEWQQKASARWKTQRNIEGRPDDFALGWVRRHGQGRIFYVSLGGHAGDFRAGRTERANGPFLRLLLAGAQFAIGDLPAETIPRDWGMPEEALDFAALQRRIDAAVPHDRAAILRTLPSYADSAALPLLTKAAQDENATVRLAAVRALGMLADRSAIPVVKNALTDRDPEVKKAALQALERLDRVEKQTRATHRQPGLRLRFNSLAAQKSDDRTARLLALHVPRDESPTPFLDPGPFEAVWEGHLEIAQRDNYTFHFEGNGLIELSIGERAVRQRDSKASLPIHLTPGAYPLRLRYRRPESEPARLRILWSSSRFGPEPIPPTLLTHDGSNELTVARQLREARSLLADRGCVRCHRPDDSTFATANAMPELRQEGPDLMEVGARLQARWIQQWLEDPRAVPASTCVPHLVNRAENAADIAAYLATLGAPPRKSIEGDAARIEEGAPLYAAFGCVACHTLGAAADENGERSSLAHLADKWHEPALAAYLMNPARNHPSSRMPDFGLSRDEAGALAAFLFQQSGRSQRPAFVNGSAARGSDLVQQRGCLNCHAAPGQNRLESPPLQALLASDWRSGCVAEEPARRGQAPYLALSAPEREALRALAREGFASLGRHSSIEFAARQVRALDCRACHEIDGQKDRWSAVAPEVAHWLRNEEVEEDATDVAQRRPALTWAGGKLQLSWIESVLSGTLEQRARPWMEARMPAFGSNTSLLARGMVSAHGLDPEAAAPNEINRELAKLGEQLVGRTGLACIDCHATTIGGTAQLGAAPGVALPLLAKRLLPEYFHRWTLAPDRIDPQSPMPRYADAQGRTPLTQILEGDARRQFEAIWHYLLGASISGARMVVDWEAEGHARHDWAKLHTLMDKGPFFSGAIEIPGAPRTPKGIAVRLGDRQQATVYFDTDLLRVSAGWTGGFVTFGDDGRFGTRNLRPKPVAQGDVRFLTPAVTGWKDHDQPRFTDTRPRRIGPIPAAQGRYEGLYLHGQRVVFSYTIRGTEVRESPWYVERDQEGVFIRDLRLGRHDNALAVLLFEGRGGKTSIEPRGPWLIARSERNQRVTVAAIEAGAGLQFVEAGGLIALQLNPQPATRTVRLFIWEGDAERLDAFLTVARGAGEPSNLDQLSEPGPNRWGTPLATRGEVGESHGPYAVDVLTAPHENPHQALLFFSGLDFLPDGRAVLSTIHGDVWLVDGIDESLQRLAWRRFATGLFQPYGVKVREGKIYVSGRDQITVLHDRDGSGEADYYENFCNLIEAVTAPFQYALGLETDAAGNFYFAIGHGGSAGSDHSNALARVPPDGRSLEIVATGWRMAFGMGISPEGHVTLGDQEGNWVPQTRLDLITRPGGFYGFQPERFRPDSSPREVEYAPPLVWLPRNVDNSAGGQVWVDSEKWGLPAGQMLHLSYGRSAMMLVMPEQVGDYAQAGVANLPVRFLAAPRSGRFRAADGQLYVAGMRAPHGPAADTVDGALERVRYTGQKAHLPVALHAHANGLRLRFNHPLDPSVARERSHYTVHRWNYRWTKDYGSRNWSVRNPAEQGEDPVEVISATLFSDGRELFLEIADLQPVMQMRLAFALKTADGTEIRDQIHNTVHALRPAFQPPAAR